MALSFDKWGTFLTSCELFEATTIKFHAAKIDET